MDLYTQLSKSEYLEELKSKTTDGLPTMATGPWAILRLLTSANDKNPFYGNITSTGFELIRNFTAIPVVVGIKGELHEEGQLTRISTKVDYLVFPLILYIIVLGALVTIGIVNYLQMNDIIAGLLPIAFGAFIAAFLSIIYKMQIRQIRRMLIEKTSANN